MLLALFPKSAYDRLLGFMIGVCSEGESQQQSGNVANGPAARMGSEFSSKKNSTTLLFSAQNDLRNFET